MLLPQSNTPFSFRVAFAITFLAFAVLPALTATAAKPQLVCSATLLHFGWVEVGKSETQWVVLTNKGSTQVTLSAISASGSGFSVSGATLPVILDAGHSIGVKVTFTPSSTVWFDDQITFTSNASNPSLVLAVAGTGVKTQLSAKPSRLSFGPVPVGTSVSLPVVVTNNTKATRTLSGFQAFGSEFSISDPPPAVTLDPGQSVTVNLTFTPQTAGMACGSLWVIGPQLNVPAIGQGVETGQLSASPGSLNFGNVLVGAADTQSASLSAANGSVTISSMTSNNSQFAVSGLSFPFTISSGNTVEFKVAFTPQGAGSVSGTLSFSSNATNGSVSEPLAGSGQLPQVVLTWIASTSDVAGYNIYRRLVSASTYRKINSSLDPDTFFTDTTVAPGNTYVYVTTAVSPSGQESSYSNPVEIAVP